MPLRKTVTIVFSDLKGSTALTERIDAEAGKVTLKHGEIKNLDMPAMQMAYRVADPAWLKTLQVGDKVKFEAAKVNGQFTITAITVAK